jgi:hypothetical protein
VLFVEEFGPGGAALWADLHQDEDTADMTVLVQEACRITDRLDRLDSALKADNLFDLVERSDGVLELKVDSALSEARQQANALRLLLNDIAKRRGVGGDDEGDGLADL